MKFLFDEDGNLVNLSDSDLAVRYIELYGGKQVSIPEPRPTKNHVPSVEGYWVLPADFKKSFINNLNEDFNRAMVGLHNGWPDYEIQTWTVQAEEAKSWLSASEHNKPEIPFLTNLHEKRKALGWEGTLEDLVNRVMQNTIAYTTATASLIARRHVAEKQIEEAEDPSTVTWDFSL